MLSVGAIPPDAATTVTPAWTEPRRGYHRYPIVDEPLGAVTTVTLMWLNFWAQPRPLPLRECTVHGASSFCVRAAVSFVGYTTVPMETWMKQLSAPGHLCEIGSISYMRADQTHAVPRTPSLVGFADGPSQDTYLGE